jgi:hypothetical protein
VEIIQVQLIGVISVTDDSLIDSNEDFVAYSIAGFTQGGNEITFYGTPIPQTGDYFLASYYNSPDYITFLAELRELIDDHR